MIIYKIYLLERRGGDLVCYIYRTAILFDRNDSCLTNYRIHEDYISKIYTPYMGIIPFKISVVVAISFIAAAITILDYLRYIPDIITIIKNPSELIRIPKNIIESYRFRRFWRQFVSDGPIVVVFPAKDLDDHREGTTKFDHQGLQKLLDRLNSEFRNIETKPIPDDQFGNEHKRHNIISVAGPIPNDISYDVLYNNNVEYHFEQIQTGKIINTIVSKEGNVELEPDTCYDKNDDEVKCTKDYGIITRMRSPYDNNKEIINIAGGYGEGTLAGCELLQNPSVLYKLENEGGRYFQALYSVSIEGDGVITTPQLLSEDDEWDHIIKPIIPLHEPDQ